MLRFLKSCLGRLSFRVDRVSNSHALLKSVNECLAMLSDLCAVRCKRCAHTAGGQVRAREFSERQRREGRTFLTGVSGVTLASAPWNGWYSLK